MYMKGRNKTTRRKKNFHQWIKYNFKSVGDLLVISLQVFCVPGVGQPPSF
jgi:hypothetical protein